jgi:hypothetical protein
VERVIGKRITFEDVEQSVDTDSEEKEHSSNPFSPLIGHDNEDKESEDADEKWRESKYDDGPRTGRRSSQRKRSKRERSPYDE